MDFSTVDDINNNKKKISSILEFAIDFFKSNHGDCSFHILEILELPIVKFINQKHNYSSCNYLKPLLSQK